MATSLLAPGFGACDQGLDRAVMRADAVLRAYLFALAIDAKDDAAVAFYRHHGFEMYGGQPKQLIVPFASFSGAA